MSTQTGREQQDEGHQHGEDHDHGEGHDHYHTRGEGHDHDHGEGHDHDHDHDGSFLAKVRHALTPHSHDHTEVIQTAAESSAEGVRAAWVSLVGMAVTAVLQIGIVWLSGSIALLADTVHNLGHLVTTIPLIIAFRLGMRRPTKRYSYGFRRAEDLVGLLIGAVIALSAALIVWESVRALAHPRDLSHLWWVLAAALVGAGGNEAVARYRIRVGRRISSAALVAEGQHARTDALTSLAVVAGAAGAWLGFPQVDAVVGLIIAAVILLILVRSMRTTVTRLMDGVDHGTLDRIESVAAAVPGVLAVAEPRARWTGHRMEADLTVHLDPGLTLQEGDAVAHRVHEALLTRVPHLDRAGVHACAGVPAATTG